VFSFGIGVLMYGGGEGSVSEESGTVCFSG
jgi:hypothetical protein